MHGANKQSYLHFKDLLPQLDIHELETAMREIASLLVRRKSNDPKHKEKELLRQLNEECVLPQENLERFHFLNKKRGEGELPKRELEELFALIKEEEGMRVKRVKVLGELSLLKGIPLVHLAKDLGLAPPTDA